MSPRLKDFLKEAVYTAIGEELDDPSSYDPKEASDIYAAWEEAAAFLGFGLDETLKDTGTTYEVERFRRIMTGTYEE